MTFDFAGNEMEAFNVSTANVVEQAIAGYFDTACSRTAIRLGLGSPAGEYADTPTVTARTTRWLHCYYRVSISSAASNAAPILILFNDVGTQVFRIYFPNANNVTSAQAQYWNGATWVNIGAAISLVASTTYTFDLEVVCGASGSFRFFINSSILAASGSATMTAVTNIARARFHTTTSSGSSGNQSYVSQVILANESTLGHQYYTKPPTADGANTTWSGTFADVDETPLSQADFIESLNANEVETFTGAAITIPPNVVVKAVVVSGQMKNVAGGPQNAQGALRKGGVNYFSANIPGVGLSYAPAQAIFENDPSTAVPWVPADAVAATLEFGYRSIA